MSHSAPLHSRCGTCTEFSLDGDREVVTDLVRCVHCFYTWKWLPGSGRRRGFCLRCNGFTCGHVECEKGGCVPQEQWMDNVENGRLETYRPIIVSVPSLPPGFGG